MDFSDLLVRLGTPLPESALVSISFSRPTMKDATILRERWKPREGSIAMERFSEKQAFQASIPAAELGFRFEAALEGYAQALVRFSDGEAQCLRSKAGKLTVLFRHTGEQEAGQASGASSGHDRKKRYLLDGGKPLPFLMELGIQSREGKVLADRQAKFRQICRFIELIDGLGLERAGESRALRIVDFGCGKAYLSFALYHFLSVERGIPVRMTGIDTKSDVIEFCSSLADRTGFSGLEFRNADIATWDEGEGVDLAISLHACDTATDIALAKACAAGARAVMSVPCCQHELSGQLSCESLRLMNRYGIIKERFSSLATDSLRASLMRVCGYSVDLVEFVDPEHSPKNIMLRCAKIPDARAKSEREREWRDYRALRDFLGVTPTLERLLEEAGLLPPD